MYLREFSKNCPRCGGEFRLMDEGYSRYKKGAYKQTGRGYHWNFFSEIPKIKQADVYFTKHWPGDRNKYCWRGIALPGKAARVSRFGMEKRFGASLYSDEVIRCSKCNLRVEMCTGEIVRGKLLGVKW